MAACTRTQARGGGAPLLEHPARLMPAPGRPPARLAGRSRKTLVLLSSEPRPTLARTEPPGGRRHGPRADPHRRRRCVSRAARRPRRARRGRALRRPPRAPAGGRAEHVARARGPRVGAPGAVAHPAAGAARPGAAAADRGQRVPAGRRSPSDPAVGSGLRPAERGYRHGGLGRLAVGAAARGRPPEAGRHRDARRDHRPPPERGLGRDHRPPRGSGTRDRALSQHGHLAASAAGRGRPRQGRGRSPTSRAQPHRRGPRPGRDPPGRLDPAAHAAPADGARLWRRGGRDPARGPAGRWRARRDRRPRCAARTGGGALARAAAGRRGDGVAARPADREAHSCRRSRHRMS